jgi:hypothetical protein
MSDAKQLRWPLGRQTCTSSRNTSLHYCILGHSLLTHSEAATPAAYVLCHQAPSTNLRSSVRHQSIFSRVRADWPARYEENIWNTKWFDLSYFEDELTEGDESSPTVSPKSQTRIRSWLSVVNFSSSSCPWVRGPCLIES